MAARDESGRASRHEDEVSSLTAQISFLDEEIAVLRRRLADSPRQVRLLEERLRETEASLTSVTSQNAHSQFAGSIGIPFNTTSTDANVQFAGFSSRHTGGAQFAMMDGSVRFLRDTVADETRRSLGTATGGDVATNTD